MRKIILSILFILFFGFFHSAFAYEIEHYFTGHIDSIDNSDCLFATGISTASTFTGIIRYDSDAAPTRIQNGALYEGILLSITIDGLYTIEIQNPSVGVFLADWASYLEIGLGEGVIMNNDLCPIDSLTVNFIDTSISALDSIGLPLTINGDDFNIKNVTLISEGALLYGVIDNIVLSGDSDSDGVPDPIDLCQGTPEGAMIKANGCVEGDYDNDGDMDGDDLEEFSKNYGK